MWEILPLLWEKSSIFFLFLWNILALPVEYETGKKLFWLWDLFYLRIAQGSNFLAAWD